MRANRTKTLTLTLALGLGLWGCAVMPSPVSERAAPARLGTASLTLQPRLMTGRSSQAVVSRHTAASIARLDAVPYLETGTNVYQPMSSTTGQPTSDADPALLKASQMASDLVLARTVRLTGLAPNKKYRIFARAYDAQGTLISSDASSYVEVTVTNDDAPTATALPLRLTDVTFAARAEIGLSNGTNPAYDHVVTSLAAVSGGTETPVAGTSQTIAKAQVPMTVRLDGLQANTTYRLNASLRDASDTQLATASVDIAVTNDDAPASQSIALTVQQLGILAGAYPTATSGFADGTGTAARFYQPYGIAVDASGSFYVADYGNHAIRKVTPAGVVTILAGAYPTATMGFVDGTGTAARFKGLTSIAIGPDGNLYVTDQMNHAIRKVTPAGVVTTLAGNGTAGYADGTGTAARFWNPSGIAVDAAGTVYVSDSGNHAIRKVTPEGVVTTLAGASPTVTAGFADGTGTAARFNTPWGIAVNAAGNLYVADSSNHAIRKITPQGVVTTVAGSYPTKASGFVDGTGTDARFKSPANIAFDAAGALYVSDTGNHAIRKVQE